MGLVRRLRRAGLSVPVASTLSFIEAVALVGDDLRSIYWAGRATMPHSPAEIELFDRVFRGWILGDDDLHAPEQATTEPSTLEFPDDEGIDNDEAAGHDEDPRTRVRFSRVEVLAERDLASLDDAERAEVDRLIDALRPSMAHRRSRRRRPAGTRGDRPDLRRTVRAALHTDGETFERHTSARVRAPRRLVLLVDVSGSMESYSRALVRFGHAAVMARRDVEVFALGTRLTRLTRELDTHDPDRALERSVATTDDWSGGTRLGEGIGRFNEQWGVKGLARGAVVVILSDGWDRGDPTEMAEQMARLGRVAHRIIWVNPLKATPGYEPLARGMAAALPFVDQFVEGHSFASLEQLASLVAAAGARDPRSGAPMEMSR